MRKLLFLLNYLVYISFGFSQDTIRFENTSFKKVIEKAKAENKPVFLMGYASWCEHCKKMKETVFKTASVAKYFNENFICYKEDMEQGDGIILHKKFKIKAYPTYIFLDVNGDLLYQSVGEFNVEDFILEGKNSLTVNKQFPFLKQELDNDLSNSEKCLTYIMALRKARLDCSEPAKRYLDTQSDSQLLSEINWKIIANGITDINSRAFQFVLAHQNEYSSIASPIRVQRKILNVVFELLIPYVNSKDSSGYFYHRTLAQKINSYQVDSVLFNMDLTISEKLEDWDDYKKLTMENLETYSWNNYQKIKEVANLYLDHINNPEALLKAASWTKHALELNEEYTSYLLCAKLFQAGGNKSDAIDFAKKGKEMAMKYSWNYSEADNLINLLQQ